MELIILGLKHKETGVYKAFNAEGGWRKQTHPPMQFDIKVGETITINKLAPFPFQHFSSLMVMFFFPFFIVYELITYVTITLQFTQMSIAILN